MKIKNSYVGAELTSVLQKLWVNTLENSHQLFISQDLALLYWGWAAGGSTGNFSKIPWGTTRSSALVACNGFACLQGRNLSFCFIFS